MSEFFFKNKFRIFFQQFWKLKNGDSLRWMWATEGCEGHSQAGAKGRQLEIGARRGPRLLVNYKSFTRFTRKLCTLIKGSPDNSVLLIAPLHLPCRHSANSTHQARQDGLMVTNHNLEHSPPWFFTFHDKYMIFVTKNSQKRKEL